MQAETSPDLPVYSFEHAIGKVQMMTLSSMERSARVIAAALQDRKDQGPAVLLYPANSVHFVRALFGCLFRGIPAVPLMLPRRGADLENVRRVMHDAGAAFLLTTSRMTGDIRTRLAAGAPRGICWIDTDTLDDSISDNWRAPKSDRQSIAHLQYTSGSTASPKGVAVTHANILHNVAYIDEDFCHGADSVAVSWLPHFHDMGFVYGILSPALVGFRAVLLQPAEFVQDPLLWLRTISKHGATHSGGPNFAYELCVNRLAAEQAGELDLRRWRVAFWGAEVIRSSTMENFAAATSRFGFDSRAFYPAYGLAEATLKVTGRTWNTSGCRCFSRRELGEGVVREAGPGPDAVQLVSCGRASGGMEVAIVDPEKLARAEDGKVGEIWVAGPSVAAGYWQGQGEAPAAFAESLLDEEARFLRTGDLGFIHDDELFVVGRTKEVVIVRGVNHYPADLERSMAISHPEVKGRLGAAFADHGDQRERLVLVQEISRHLPQQRHAAVLQAVRNQVAAELGLVADEVLLVRKGAIPRTSSGKVQRNKCRQLYQTGHLAVLAALRRADGGDAAAPSEAPERTAGHACRESLQAELLAEARKVRPGAATRIRADMSLLGAALDSVELMQFQAAIRRRFGVDLPIRDFLADRFTFADLAELVGAGLSTKGPEDGSAGEPPGIGRFEAVPASGNETRLWMLNEIYPNCPAHRIVFGISMQGPVDRERLRRALEDLVPGHPALCCAFTFAQGKLVKRPTAPAPSVAWIDCAAIEEADGAREIERVAHSLCRLPFSLNAGVVMKCALLLLSEHRQILVTCVHHIAFDAWSADLFLQSLAECYERSAVRRTSAAGLYRNAASSRSPSWTDDDLAFWRQRLQGVSDTAKLPCDKAEGSAVGAKAAVRLLRLGEGLPAVLRRVGEPIAATAFMVLLAAFLEVLRLWTGEAKITLVSPVGGRHTAESLNQIGVYAYPLILAFDLSACGGLSDVLLAVRETAASSLARQAAPFGEIVRAVKPARRLHRLPYMDIMFNYIHRQRDSTQQVEGASWELLPLDNGYSESLLSLLFVESKEGELTGAMKYPAGRFSETTLARFDGLWEDVLERLAGMAVSGDRAWRTDAYY